MNDAITEWETDWLYKSILGAIESTWKSVTQSRGGEYGEPPDYFVVTQYDDLRFRPPQHKPHQHKKQKLLMSFFTAPAISQWIFDDSGVRTKTETDTEPGDEQVRRGMFFNVGSVYFSISSDRKLVALNFLMGPRYGRGYVLKAIEQGETGQLSHHPGFVSWIS